MKTIISPVRIYKKNNAFTLLEILLAFFILTIFLNSLFPAINIILKAKRNIEYLEQAPLIANNISSREYLNLFIENNQIIDNITWDISKKTLDNNINKNNNCVIINIHPKNYKSLTLEWEVNKI